MITSKFEIDRDFIIDERGSFLKIMNGSEDFLNKEFGEIYIVNVLVNQTRANHFHKTAFEWFTPIFGNGILILENIISRDRKIFELNSKAPKTYIIPPNYAHSLINNNCNNFTIIAYSSIKYDKADTFEYIF